MHSTRCLVITLGVLSGFFGGVFLPSGVSEAQQSLGFIVATQEGREAVGQGDTVVIDQGRGRGVQAGDRFLVLEEDRKVLHPETARLMRLPREVIGEVAVVHVQEYVSTATVIASHREISYGAALVAVATPRMGQHEGPSSSGAMTESSMETRPRMAQRSAAGTTTYTVMRGDTLWGIAGQEPIYNNSMMWPMIYKANRAQIQDPRWIFPRQVFAIPRDYSAEEAAAAINAARQYGPGRQRHGAMSRY